MKTKTHFSKTELLKNTIFSIDILIFIVVGSIGLIFIFNTQNFTKTDIIALSTAFLSLVILWTLALFFYRNYVLKDILQQLEKNNYTILDFKLNPTHIEFQKNQQSFVLKIEDMSLRNIDFILEPTDRIPTQNKQKLEGKKESRTYFYNSKVIQKLLDLA